MITKINNKCNYISGTKFKTNYDFGLVQLDVAPCWPEDIGDYKSVATNKWGRDETVGGLNVEPAPEKGVPPTFITQLPTPSMFIFMFCFCIFVKK